MLSLLFVSILWAFSFSLIGVYLTGHVDVYIAIAIRFLLAWLVLIPFTRTKNYAKITLLKVMGIGAIQIGVMYIAFYHSFLYLRVPEVILLTVFTPIYISLIWDLLTFKFHPQYLLVAFLAVIGAIILRFDGLNMKYLYGILLVQIANISFAIGQTFYKRLTEKNEIKDREVFSYFYLGALFLIIPVIIYRRNFDVSGIGTSQVYVLLWLGIVASGVGYLLWNGSCKKVSAGTLAVMNNVVIPLGIIVNVVIWDREANLERLIIGGGVILLALVISLWRQKKSTQNKCSF